MRMNRFAKLLLTGKAATLPLLIGQVRAEVTPSYSDMISSDLHVIEIPVVGSSTAPGIRLQSIAGDSNSASSYGSSSAAYFCANGLPATTTVVVTGANVGDAVILAAASNKNDPLHLALDKRLTLGTSGLTIVGSAQVGAGLFSPSPDTTTKGTVSFTVKSTSLAGLVAGGRFYMQAAIVPSGSASGPVSSWRFSELDEIIVGTCTTSSYGVTVN